MTTTDPHGSHPMTSPLSPVHVAANDLLRCLLDRELTIATRDASPLPDFLGAVCTALRQLDRDAGVTDDPTRPPGDGVWSRREEVGQLDAVSLLLGAALASSLIDPEQVQDGWIDRMPAEVRPVLSALSKLSPGAVVRGGDGAAQAIYASDLLLDLVAIHGHRPGVRTLRREGGDRS